MALNRRRFTRDFTLQVIREVEAGKTVAQAAREHQRHSTLICRWDHEHQPYTDQAFMGNGRRYQYEARIAELERLLGQLTMGNVLLKKALLRLEARQRGPSRPGGS